MNVSRLLISFILVMCGLVPPSSSTAQSFPAKVVRLVVPSAPGGSNDVVARAMSQPLSRAFGQPVVVENRPGANNLIGIEAVKNAPADGHAVLIGGFTFIANAALRAKPTYDPRKDFAAVAGIGQQPYLISVHPSVPVKSIKELVALARARPGELVYAINGYGTAQHLSGELLKLRARIDMKVVVFQGGAPSAVAVLGGHAGALISTIAPVIQHVSVGKLRALAVTSRERSTLLKEVPTMMEVGFADFDITGALGVFAPGATPKDAIARFSAEIVKAVALPEVSSGLLRDGYAVVPVGHVQFQEFVLAKFADVQALGKAANMRLD